MTEERLKEIRARCEAATPPPWVTDEAESDDEEIREECLSICTPDGLLEGDNPAEVAEFIAHARQDVPDLLAEVERLRAFLFYLRDHPKLSGRLADSVKDVLAGRDYLPWQAAGYEALCARVEREGKEPHA